MQKIICLTSKCFIVLFIFIFVNSIQAQKNDIWKQIGPEGGKASSIVVQPNDDIFVVSTERVFVKRNNSQNWEMSNKGLDSVRVELIASDSINLYAGTNDGIYKSTNNGQTWFPSNKGIQNSAIWNILYSQGKLLITIVDYTPFNQSFYYSLNGGNEWIKLNTGLARNPIEVAMNDTYIYLLSRGEGLFKSKDLGTSWEVVNTDDISSFYLGMHPENNLMANNNYILLEVEEHGLYISKDNGDNWYRISLYYGNSSSIMHFLYEDEIYCYSNGPYNGFLYKIDKELNETNLSENLPNNNFLSFIKKDNRLYLGTWLDGLYISDNMGLGWFQDINKFMNMKIEALNSDSPFDNIYNSNIILAGNMGIIYRSSDDGYSWSKYPYLNPYLSFKDFYQISPLKYLLSIDGSYYCLSTDQGNSWKLYDNSIRDVLYWNNNILVAITLGKSAISIFNDFDNTMKPISNNNIPTNLIYCLEGIGNNILAGTRNGIYESQDNGYNWIAKDNIISNKDVLKLIKTEVNIFALTKDGIYKSSDFGNNWAIINSEFIDSNTVALISVQNYLFLADDKGLLYLSKDLGNTWQIIYDGSKNLAARINALARHGDYLLVGTTGSSILKAKFSDLGLVVGVAEEEHQENLNSIYPNPATEYISINLSSINPTLKRGVEGEIVVEIYDVMGVKIQSTPVETKNFSSLQNINISYLTPGIYFVKIVCSNGACSIVEKFVKY